MNTKEMIEVMQAFVDGKQIQRKCHIGDWEDYIGQSEWNWFLYNYRIKPEEEKPQLMTNMELAEWLAKGNGQVTNLAGSSNKVLSTYEIRDRVYENYPVNPSALIRSWGSDEWIEPTVDIYERDCKGGK